MQASRSYKSKAKGSAGSAVGKGKFNKHEPETKIKYEDLPRLTHAEALIAKKDAMARGAKCEQCPLFLLRSGPVMSEIVEDCNLAVMAESPGANEVEQKRPMVGKSGQFLNEALSLGGVEREDCSIINSINCRPPEGYQNYEKRIKIQYEVEAQKAKLKGEAPPPKPLTPAQCCSPRLQNDMRDANPKYLLVLGQAALRATADYYDVPFGTGKKLGPGQVRIASLKKQLGSPLELPNGPLVVATYHPAFGMRKGSRHFLHVIKDNIIRAAEISVRGHINWVEPPFHINPTVEEIEQTLQEFIDSGEPVVIDIETDKGNRPDGKFDPFSCRLRCIGFGTRVESSDTMDSSGPALPGAAGEAYIERLICVPIRRMNGEDWWEKGDKKRVLTACMKVLNSCRLVGHNLAFDTQVLLRLGLIKHENRNATWDDTMLMARNTQDCDLPKDLGFVASRYFEVPSWKGGGGTDKFFDRVSDTDLQIYNLRDCVTCLRLYYRLQEEIARWGTTSQNDQDKEMAPFVRDMGTLGLFVDEKKRGEIAVRMNKEAFSRLHKLKEIVGNKKFNPNSPPQVRDFLFRQKKLIPSFNSKGENWEDGEDPSTNEKALTKITTSQALDDEAKEFINVFLEYKKYMKLKGTYIDNIKVYYPDWTKFGYDIEMVPEVKGPVWQKFSVKDRAKIAANRYPAEWGAANKAGKSEILKDIEDGEWKDEVIIPARPAMSILPITYKMHVVSCVIGETFVFSKDGPKQIKDIVGWGLPGSTIKAESYLKLHNGDGFNDVSHLINPGIQETWRIETALGMELTGTPHHRVVASERGKKFQKLVWNKVLKKYGNVPIEPNDEWRRLDNFQVGDYIRVPIGVDAWSAKVPKLDIRPIDMSTRTNFKKTIKIPTEVSEDLVKFVGLYQADGSISDHNGTCRIRISNQNPHIRALVYPLCQRLFGVEAVSLTKKDIVITSIALKAWAEDIGLRRRIKNKTAPQWILSCPKRYVLEYIKGCMLDSHVYLSSGVTPFWVYCGSRNLVREMQMLLLNLGIATSMTDGRVNSKHPHSWELRATAEDAIKACQLSGHVVPEATRVGGYARPKFLRRGNNLWLRVLKSEPAGLQQVYDLSVPGPESYLAGGTVSHNSARLSSTPNCFDNKTEILTDRGWTLFKDLQDDDKVAQYWWDSETFDFVRPSAKIVKDHDGELVHIESGRLNIACTDDHRFTGRDSSGKNIMWTADMWPTHTGITIPTLDNCDAVQMLTTEAHVTRRHYNGKVYCVIVPSDMIIIRRHGKSAIANNCQNWSKTGKVNTHEMFICPPGHVMVGADLDQVELRLYTGIAGDKLLREAFEKGLDPHSYNAASMFAKKKGLSVWDTYLWIVGMPFEYGVKAASALGAFTEAQGKLVAQKAESAGKTGSKLNVEGVAGIAGCSPAQIDAFISGFKKGDKEKKKLRGYAKTFCIAEGQRVLTDRGLVPIQDVKLEDKLWDGVEWVSHMGVICTGIKEVIEYEGLTATPDHKVWTDDGRQICFADAKASRARLARGGHGRHPIRYMGDSDEGLEKRKLPVRSRKVHNVSGGERRPLRQHQTVRDRQRKSLENGRTPAAVYDIINSGPRRRFTVEGVICSNCYLELYGGSPDKLYTLMSTLRDKATGALLFPDLRESDVADWHIAWHETHPETKAWQELCSKGAKVEGYTASPIGTGRKRFFPDGANKDGATANHSIQCLPKSAFVLTDRGYMTIEDLLNAGGTFNAHTGKEFAPASIIHRGQDRIFKITFKDGNVLEATLDHKLKAPDEEKEDYVWRAVSELKPGDRVARVLSRPMDYGEYLADEDAFWIGYYVGNGWVSRDTVLLTIGDCHHAPMHFMVDRCLSWIESNGWKPHKVKWLKKDPLSHKDNPRSVRCDKTEATHANVMFGSINSTREFMHLSSMSGLERAHTKRVPSRIRSANLSARKSFVVGYLTADAYLMTKQELSHKAIQVHSPNYDLLRGITLLGHSIGYRGTIGNPHKTDKKGHTARHLTFQRGGLHDSLGIGPSAVTKGGELAPLFEARKLLSIDLPAPCKSTPAEKSARVLRDRVRSGGTLGINTLSRLGFAPQYDLVEIKSIEDTGRIEEVYTLSVDHPDHSYVSEGLISKNCSSAEIMNAALIKIAEQIPYKKWTPHTGLFLQVHDYIGVIVPREYGEYAKAVIEKALNTSVFGIKITATAQISDRLSDQ